MSKFLASAGLFPIHCPIRENPPMFFQFGPKLENLMMILCKAFFSFKHFTIMGHNTLTKVTRINLSPPPPPKKKKSTLGQFVLQNYGALYFVMDMFINIKHNYAF